MTKSLTLAGPPRAESKSKPHHYKQSTKNETPPGNIGVKGKPVCLFQTKKRAETLFSTFQKNPLEHKGHGSVNWTRPSLTGGIKLNKTWKIGNSYQKRLEICKNRAKSSPDIFQILVVLAGHDIITDNGRGTTCRCKLRALSLQTKRTKNEVLSENMGFNGKKFKNFKWEKIKINFQPQQKTAQITRPLNTTNEDGPCIQEEIKRRKIEKFIQIITIGTLQPRTKESFPDMFTSYVDLASHDMITKVGSAITCRCKVWALSLETKCTKN